MPLSFKTESPSEPTGRAFAEKLQAVLSLAAVGLSLAGFCLSLGALRSIHPQKLVEISCSFDMAAELQRSVARLETIRAQVLKNNTIK